MGSVAIDPPPAAPATRQDAASPTRAFGGATLSIERQMVIWACALVGLGVALYVLGSTVTPFALGIALGYLLDPVVQKLERLGLNRLGASLLILGAFIIVVAAALILVAPILGHQLISFIHSLPSYISRLQQLAVDQGNVLLDKYGGSWRAKFGLSQPLSTEQIENSLTDFVAERARWLLSASESLLYGGKALLSFFSILVITPVVAFYILVDWDKMVRALDIGLPRDHHDALRQMAHEINLALAGFLRGQSLVGLFLGIWYAAGLTLIGLDFGFLIGVGGGLLSFIPYVGSLTVLVISLGVAIVQGWPNWSLFLSTLGIVLVGQFLEGNVLSPKLVGDSVGLHPVWVMFALVAFGELFGLTGLLIAVPTAAAIGVLVRHLAALYLAGSLYRGHDAADGEAS